MRTLVQRASCLLAFGLVLIAPAPSFAQGADPDPARFAEDIEVFTAWDSQNAVPEDGVLFVGSSSIVRWPTMERFSDLPVINRGFGGSHISDVNHYIEETVLRHDPALIVFYAGNNDINVGKTAAQVSEDYQEFVGKVHARRPETDILFISIHPSLARWERWGEMQVANEMVRAFSESDPTLHYVDIAPPMLGTDGTPIPELFVADGLHLTPAGYDVWTPIVAHAIDAIQEN